jgi:hypothetical protein
MRTVIVRGGASGIGLATSEALAARATGSSWPTGTSTGRVLRSRGWPRRVVPSKPRS